MKIRKVEANNRKGEFRVVTYSGDTYVFPYVKAEPQPNSADRVADAYVDQELGREAFTYVLESGDEGSVHLDQVLEYNEDPNYLRDLLIYQLTVEAKKRVDESGLSRRELARRLKTSVPQLYRLLDTTNTRKSMNQLISLLQVLDCSVDVIVTGNETGA
ncbi:MAG: helix-turn-helix transcriptional regulator [Deltaproteobacteria bacterium]|nr:helix-turn-helix transcriptional regulator [Deltaproteobacteria bacterium]